MGVAGVPDRPPRHPDLGAVELHQPDRYKRGGAARPHRDDPRSLHVHVLAISDLTEHTFDCVPGPVRPGFDTTARGRSCAGTVRRCVTALMRNGVPLPGRTPEQVVSQLVHRVLGPLRRDGVRMVLDYHGLTGIPAGTPEDTAQRCGTTVRTLAWNTGKVRAAGAAFPLDPSVVTAAMRRSGDHDDHLARVRIARTLHLPVPKAPLPARLQAARPDLRTARASARILAAVGPLDWETLLGAIARYQRYRNRPPLSPCPLLTP